MRNKLVASDFMAFGVIWGVFIVHWLQAGTQLMWGDEIFSLRLIHDPSLAHSLASLGDGCDGAPPLYYLCARQWTALVGEDPFQLRLFSTVMVAMGFSLLWWRLRPVFQFWPVLLAMVSVGASSLVIPFEATNIRFYGLLFFLACVAAVIAIHLAQAPNVPGWRLLAANGVVNSAMILCHPLGGIYSAALLGGVVIARWLKPRRGFQISVVVSYLLSWLAVFLWWKQFLVQAQINHPHGWIPSPTGSQIAGEIFHGAGGRASIIMGGLFVVMALVNWMRRRSFRTEPISTLQRDCFCIAAALVAVNPLLGVFSVLVPAESIYLPRYLLPTLVGWIILLSRLLHVVVRSLSQPPWVMPVVAAIVIGSMPWWLWPVSYWNWNRYRTDPRADIAGNSDSAFGHEDLPIVCQRSSEFLPRHFYAKQPDRYYFLLDEKACVPLQYGPINLHLLSALARHYPDMDHVVQLRGFLRDHPVFLLVDDEGAPWSDTYLAGGKYRIIPLEPDHPIDYKLEGEKRLLLVEKMDQSQAPVQISPAPGGQ